MNQFKIGSIFDATLPNILYLNSNHTVAPISVSVAAVNFGVDRTIIVSKSVDPRSIKLFSISKKI